MSDTESFTFVATCGPCWRDTQSSPWPGVHWTDYDEHGWADLICPIHGSIFRRANFGALDVGLIRETASAERANDLSLFFEEWENVVTFGGAVLTGGQLEGGYICGHCGAHNSLTGDVTSCGCGR